MDAILPPGSYPVSPVQKGMLVHSLWSPDAGFYLQQLIGTLHETLDVPRFRAAWSRLLARHAVLRSAFCLEDLDAAVQRVCTGVELPWQEADWRDLSDQDQLRRLRAYLESDRRRGFDFARAPLIRVALFRTGEAEYRLIWTSHHALFDGRARLVLLKELFALYEALVRGEAPVLSRPRPFREYIDWLQTQDLTGSRPFWTGVLDGIPTPTPLPVDPLSGGRGPGRRGLTLSKDETASLEGFARAHGLTLNTLVQGAWALLLSTYSGEPAVVFGAAKSCRHWCEGARDMVGNLVNTLPVAVKVEAVADLVAWLQGLRAQWVALRLHEHTPLVDIQRWCGRAGRPLFESLVAFETEPMEAHLRAQGGGWRDRDFRIIERSNYPLNLLGRGGPMLGLEIAFERARYTQAFIDRLLDNLRTLLIAMGEGAGRRLNGLPRLSEAEGRQVLVTWNDTARERARGRFVHLLFEVQARRNPDALAVACGEHRLRYGELNRRANRLAHHLIAQGVGPETLVGVCLERSAEVVVALMGILKAGGAYLPLDPDQPADRLAYMLADADAPYLITRDGAVVAIPGYGGQVIRLGPEATQACKETDPTVDSGPDRLAYVIYTSGSTGRPKGVGVCHGAVANYIAWMGEAFAIMPEDRVLGRTTIGFDPSVWEIFLPLSRGAALILAGSDARESASRLIETMERERVSILSAVPALLEMLVSDGELSRCHTLRTVFCGGDVLPRSLQERFFSQCAARLYNLYGPTEATIASTWYPCDRGAHSPVAPIGRPIDNVCCYVLDGARRPLPVGAAGELYIGGAGVARGYRNRPNLTRERFVADPFGGSGGRLYRTGDRVRWRGDGTLEFLGRVDHQVKLRGYRIELGEIEAVLGEHPRVAEAVVMLREDRLVAYVRSQAGTAPRREALSGWLKGRLPNYMHPAAYVCLETFPLGPNGKLDRKALPAPQEGQMPKEKAAPRTPLEELLAGLYAEVLGVAPPGIHDDFFELGGHSLSATRLAARIRATLGVDLPLREVFHHPTVAGIAGHIEARHRRGADGAPALRRMPRPRWIPASFAQRRLWFLERLHPGSARYNITVAYRLSGPLDTAALGQAFDTLISRHEVLRTRFACHDGEPVQVIAPEAHLDLGIERSDEAGVARHVARLAGEPFDLEQGPLIRARLLCVDRQVHVLVLALHHSVSDGWSMGVWYRELGGLYGAYARGRAAALPELPVQYADYTLWQREWLEKGECERQLRYWRERLRGAPTTIGLPTERGREPARGASGAVERFVLSPELGTGLQALSRREGVTLFMTLLGAFKVLLYRYSGQADMVVGTPIAGRTRPELEPLIGMFVNTLVLRTDLGGEPGFRTLLARIRKTCLDAYAHQDLPFERLVEVLAPQREPGRNPLFQGMFVLQNTHQGSLRLDGVETERRVCGSDTAKFDLTLSMTQTDGVLEGALEYSTERFAPATARAMAGHLRTVLQAVVADPERPISRLPLLTDAERRRLLVQLNANGTAYPRGCGVPQLFEAQVRRTPEAVAVVCAGRHLSYAELNRRANRLAHHLIAQGVGPEQVVGVCLARSQEMIVSLLAILKAGGAYLPLDPACPKARLSMMLEEAGARIVVSEAALLEALPESGVQRLCLEREAKAIAARTDTDPAVAADPERLAYVIYTSGSTGRPKGVAVVHRAIARLVIATDYIALGPRDRVAQVSTAAFDAATFEIWGALLNGARLVILPKQTVLTPGAFANALHEQGITTLFLTTALFNLMVQEAPEAFSGVENLLFGGEAADGGAVARLMRHAPPRRLLNVYGPTENTTFSTWHRIERAPRSCETIPIGRPIANTQCFVLDRHGEPVPVGVVGELYLGGEGLARGYLGHAVMTRERFVTLDLAGAKRRLYRTGDRVRYRADGAICFVGRVDQQVKIRGYRIEPAEIEAVLARHPGVNGAVVICPSEPAGARRLIAYCEQAPGSQISEQLLKAHVKEALPEYMVPSAVVVLDRLPLNENGKIDRHALPLPGPRGAPERCDSPAGAVQQTLAGIWSRALGVASVGPDDNFFELGGHSLLAVRVLAEVERRLGRRLPISALFEAPTVARLAERLAAVGEGFGHGNALVAVRAGGSRAPFFLVHGIAHQLERHLDPRYPLYFLHHAHHRENVAYQAVETIAAQHVAGMRTIQPHGPYHLGGYSFGGLLAYEIAQQLRRAGEEVALLALFDPTSPLAPPPQRGPDAAGLVRRLGRLREIEPGGRVRQLWVKGSRVAVSRLNGAWVTKRLKDRLCRWYLASDRPLPAGLRRYHFAGLYKRAARSYQYRPYPGRISLFVPGRRPSTGGSDAARLLGWEALAEGGVELCPIAGARSHGDLFREPYVRGLAEALNRCLADADRSVDAVPIGGTQACGSQTGMGRS